jgi:hypothetical protein
MQGNSRAKVKQDRTVQATVRMTPRGDPTPEEIAEMERVRDEIKAGWTPEERARRIVGVKPNAEIEIKVYRASGMMDNTAEFS